MSVMKRAGKWLCLTLTFLFCMLSLPVRASAAGTTPPDLSDVRAVCFYHLESEQMIREVTRYETDRIPAGATPKVMAGLLACELLAGRLDEQIEVTREMIADSSGRMSAMLGKATASNPVTATVEQLLALALCGSYNDAYDVLAIASAGSREAFVAKMNERAGELGVDRSDYRDVSGIGDNSMTTAYDLLLVARAATANELYMNFCSADSYELPTGTIYNPVKDINPKGTGYSCNGLSVGSTTVGGGSVVTLAEKGGDRYLCVILGSPSLNHAYGIARSVISWGFSNYAYREVLNPKTKLGSIPVTVSDVQDEVKIGTDRALSFFLPARADLDTEITYSVRLLYDSLEAPVEEGMLVGYVSVRYGEKTLGTAPLYAKESVGRSSMISGLNGIKSLTGSRTVRAAIVFFAVGLAVWAALEWLARRRRRRFYDYHRSRRSFRPDVDRPPRDLP